MKYILFALALSLQLASAQTAGIRGLVTDPSGAFVPKADVRLRDANGREQRTVTNDNGNYELRVTRPGNYTLVVQMKGFTPYAVEALEINQMLSFNVQLTIATQAEKVDVQDAVQGVTTDPLDNAGAITIKEEDLKSFSDDPDTLSDELQALAGPGAGPNGGQIYIDGFTGGKMPAKSSIREIRINRNPYSAEFDRVGFGRIEILTKPGTDKFRGDVFFNFGDRVFNSRNPFADNKPPYRTLMYGGRISGPINKKSSFGLDIEARNVDENAVVNATILNAELMPTPFQQAVVTPQTRYSISPRLDYALNDKNTLILRYSYSPMSSDNRGVGDFALPTRGYDTRDRAHSIQLTETAVLNARSINEFRFQFNRSTLRQFGDNSIPAENVLDAFNGGGAQTGLADQRSNRYEFSDAVSYIMGKHSFKFGGRVRGSSLDDISPNNFGGTYSFAGGIAPVLDASNNPIAGAGLMEITSIERYRRTLYFQGLGYTPAQIRLLGGGASQLTINGGNPQAGVRQWDTGLFGTWDWRASARTTVSAGLRWEDQTNISNHNNFAPRIGVAYALDGRNGKATKTVLRLGGGVFYDRVDDSLTLNSRRFNGVNQVNYIVPNPDFYPNTPTTDQLAPFANVATIRQLSSDLKSAYVIQTSAGIERQLPKSTTMAVNYIFTRGVNMLRSRNINTPALDGTRPYGNIGNIFLNESTGFSRQHQVMTNFNTRFSRHVSLFGFYMLNYARSDTDGAGSSPADPYNLHSEWGPSRMDTRHRMVMGGSINAKWGISLNPFLMASTGAPFNIITGRDTNGDSLFLDRPAFATDLNASGVVQTPFGNFQTVTGPNSTLIPRNYARGPGQFTLNLRLGKAWSFGGDSEGAAGGPGGDMGMGGPMMRGGPGGGGGPRGGGGDRGFRGGPGGPGGMFGGGGNARKKYTLSLSIQARNVLNNVNLATPNGNLTSAFFGTSTQTAGGFGPGGGGGAGPNRRIELSLRFSF
ncbi:MAG: carboxypeptidase-like regulatory domain-containing protein [Acidobacteriota bacterium]